MRGCRHRNAGPAAGRSLAGTQQSADHVGDVPSPAQVPAEGSVAGDSTVQLQQVHDSSQHSQTAGLRRTCHPMSELWHSMQLLNQVETNTEGITRVRRRADFYTFVLYCHISLSFGQIHRRYKNLIF